ncbi:hypothetical protein [Clostridium tetani]|nr:hypothetical protein [Clostridium tetani]
MIKEKFTQLMSKRLSLEINDDFGLEEVWEKEVFILTECSDEDFFG